jgi:hypothetical protein
MYMEVGSSATPAFYMDHDGNKEPRYAWFDTGDRMICYRLGDCLYKYDTTKDDDRKNNQIGDSSDWDHQINLPLAPSPNFQRWNVYGGYRPSLLSPHHLTFTRNDEKHQHFQHTLLHALRCKQLSKKRCSECTLVRDNPPVSAAKRLRE